VARGTDDARVVRQRRLEEDPAWHVEKLGL